MKHKSTNDIKVIKGYQATIDALIKDNEFKDNRISDLLVERDKGIWRNNLIENIEKQLTKHKEDGGAWGLGKCWFVVWDEIEEELNYFKQSSLLGTKDKKE